MQCAALFECSLYWIQEMAHATHTQHKACKLCNDVYRTYIQKEGTGRGTRLHSIMYPKNSAEHQATKPTQKEKEEREKHISRRPSRLFSL